MIATLLLAASTLLSHDLFESRDPVYWHESSPLLRSTSRQGTINLLNSCFSDNLHQRARYFFVALSRQFLLSAHLAATPIGTPCRIGRSHVHHQSGRHNLR